jgi:hypothetical protein
MNSLNDSEDAWRDRRGESVVQRPYALGRRENFHKSDLLEFMNEAATTVISQAGAIVLISHFFSCSGLSLPRRSQKSSNVASEGV